MNYRIMNSCYANMEIVAGMDIDPDIKDRTARRRLVWCAELRLMRIKNIDYNSSWHEHVLLWIDKHTTGNFYFGGNHVGFEEEQDEIMFKLGFKID